MCLCLEIDNNTAIATKKIRYIPRFTHHDPLPCTHHLYFPAKHASSQLHNNIVIFVTFGYGYVVSEDSQECRCDQSHRIRPNRT